MHPGDTPNHSTPYKRHSLSPDRKAYQNIIITNQKFKYICSRSKANRRFYRRSSEKETKLQELWMQSKLDSIISCKSSMKLSYYWLWRNRSSKRWDRNCSRCNENLGGQSRGIMACQVSLARCVWGMHLLRDSGIVEVLWKEHIHWPKVWYDSRIEGLRWCGIYCTASIQRSRARAKRTPTMKWTLRTIEYLE